MDTQNIFTQAGGHLARPGRPAEMFYAVMDFAISCGGQRSNLSLLPAEYVVLYMYTVLGFFRLLFLFIPRRHAPRTHWQLIAALKENIFIMHINTYIDVNL